MDFSAIFHKTKHFLSFKIGSCRAFSALFYNYLHYSTLSIFAQNDNEINIIGLYRN